MAISVGRMKDRRKVDVEERDAGCEHFYKFRIVIYTQNTETITYLDDKTVA